MNNHPTALRSLTATVAAAETLDVQVAAAVSAVQEALPGVSAGVARMVGPSLVPWAAPAGIAQEVLAGLDPTRAADGRLRTADLPDGWPADHEHVTCHQLTPASGWLLTIGTQPLEEESLAWAGTAASVVGLGLARIEAAEDLADLRLRVDNAQQLANMGDYDWHIASDTNTWSDQLYRIYGHEPQSFNASYDRFLSLLHPEDREMIQGVHQQAYATGEPYEMVERIVRPDGETRYLASNGQVIIDESGTPVRMRGTCIDITSRILAERAGEEMSARIREAQVRRRQALEINDNVVQGLAAAVYALDHGDARASAVHLRATLDAARRMMDDLLEPLNGDDLLPVNLVRSDAVAMEVTATLRRTADMLEPQPAPSSRSAHRVVIADDSADIRYLLATMLELSMDFIVVDQVGDGRSAVSSVEVNQPDVVVLDLAMPVLDGFQALEEIREVAPDAAVVVLSGFKASSMEARALAEGADAYVEKGHALQDLEQVLRDTLRARRVHQ